MAPQKHKDHRERKERRAARQEFAAAQDTKEPGWSLPRKLLQRRVADVSDGSITSAAGHGEEASPDPSYESPQEDRAG